jgi:hypothetical protein
MAKEPFAGKATSVWMGDFFFWIIAGFKTKLSVQLSDKHERRNFITGYIISLVGLALVVFFFIKWKQ